MGCHVPHCSAQHTDLLQLPDFGASAACVASSPIAAWQNRKHVSVQCMHYTDGDRGEVLLVLSQSTVEQKKKFILFLFQRIVQ